MIRYYRLKNYLNASHFVIFNGVKGEVHPHTWEFSALLYSTGDEIQKFTNTEKAIDKIFEPYQNHILNELAPFDAIVPSLENITEYFVGRIAEAVKPFGYKLIELEGSETPVRTYGVRLDKKISLSETSDANVESVSEDNCKISEENVSVFDNESLPEDFGRAVNVGRLLDNLERHKHE
ncbi:MAG: 6-carboxytetrahydropterin synthase [Lachnospiraceae bacterium]|nr:6-carboxytetrahydropterin synthase [Lachnospiraceae bacterium]